MKLPIIHNQPLQLCPMQWSLQSHHSPHKKCLTPSCGGQLQVIPESSKIGRCSACKIAQRLDMCKHQLSAKLGIDPSSKKVQLFTYQQVLTKITEPSCEMITENALLNTEAFTVSYNNRMVITNISKWTFNAAKLSLHKLAFFNVLIHIMIIHYYSSDH